MLYPYQSVQEHEDKAPLLVRANILMDKYFLER